MVAALPVHPVTGAVALGVLASGRLVWPVRGGSEPAPEPPVVPSPPVSEPAFPANTPLEQMSTDQREAYWKDKARKHEERVKAFGGLTPEQLAELREKATKHDALEFELSSDKDKAVAEAKRTAEADKDAKYQPMLVRAQFAVAAAGRVEQESLDKILEPLDLTKFLSDSGDVDAAKVSAYIDALPGTGTPPPPRRGPSPEGHGRRESTATGQSVASGRELYRSRHPSKAS